MQINLIVKRLSHIFCDMANLSILIKFVPILMTIWNCSQPFICFQTNTFNLIYQYIKLNGIGGSSYCLKQVFKFCFKKFSFKVCKNVSCTNIFLSIGNISHIALRTFFYVSNKINSPPFFNTNILMQKT